MMWGTEDASDHLVGKPDVIAVPRLPGHLCVGIHQGRGAAHRRTCSQTVVNVVSCRLRFVSADGFRDAVEIAGRTDRAGPTSAGRLEVEFAGHAFAVLSDVPSGTSGLLTVSSRHG